MLRASRRAAAAAAAAACYSPLDSPALRQRRRRHACCDRGAACPGSAESADRLLPAAEGLGLHSQHFSVFSRSGARVSLAEVLAAAARAEAVLVGEAHDDPVAHQVELYLLVALQQRRPCSLSLEMFEVDVQTVLDEYLAGLIREADFLMDARPWVNYLSDYRLLIEFAKDSQIPVAASNVPRRYVGAVGRGGSEALLQPWPAASSSWMPPLPLPAPSAAYVEHLSRSPAVPMRTEELGIADGGGCPYMRRPAQLLRPVVLWDAAMAHSIARQLAVSPDRTVVHVCGSFHVEHSAGICEMLRHFRPSTAQLVVAIYPEEDCHVFVSERHGGAADFVVLTDASLPRSHDYFNTPAATEAGR